MNTPTTSIHCPRCRQNVAWPESASASQKEAIAARARYSRIDAIKLMRPQFGMDLKEAKCLVEHLPMSKGYCLRCGQSVNDGVSVCGNCRSVNLNW